jgi:hypothetical protein
MPRCQIPEHTLHHEELVGFGGHLVQATRAPGGNAHAFSARLAERMAAADDGHACVDSDLFKEIANWGFYVAVTLHGTTDSSRVENNLHRLKRGLCLSNRTPTFVGDIETPLVVLPNGVWNPWFRFPFPGHPSARTLQCLVTTDCGS